MNKEEAIRMLKAKLECMTRDVSGRDSDCINRRCDECSLNYEQGNMGEQKEWLRMAIKALEQQMSKRTEERTETHACDCISRQFMYDMGATCIAARNKDGDLVALGALDILPSVAPQPKEEPKADKAQQPKTGHWEWVQYESKPNFGNWHCSECRHILCGAIKGNPVKLPNYCEECGSYNGGAK